MSHHPIAPPLSRAESENIADVGQGDLDDCHYSPEWRKGEYGRLEKAGYDFSVTQPNPISRNSTCTSVQDELNAAIESALTTITNEPNLHNAFHAVSHAADTLRAAADAFAELRAEIVAKIADDEKLSLAKLADRVGVSKARAGQLVETGRRVQHLRQARG